MRRLALLVFVAAIAACSDAHATCEGAGLPDGGMGIPVCGGGPACQRCWSCQTFGSAPGWTLLGASCDAPAGADAATSTR